MNILNKAFQRAKEIGTLVALPIIIPVGLVSVLIKEEIIDELTGEKKRKGAEQERMQRRINERRERVNKRRMNYIGWGLEVTPIIARTFDSPEKIESYVSTETVEQRWGASFWDQGYRETRAILRNDGTYALKRGPSEKENVENAHFFSVDDNRGRGYNLQEVAYKFASQIADNIVATDIRTPDKDYQTYEDVRKSVRSTMRKNYIAEFKKRTGIDLRQALKAK